MQIKTSDIIDSIRQQAAQIRSMLEYFDNANIRGIKLDQIDLIKKVKIEFNKIAVVYVGELRKVFGDKEYFERTEIDKYKLKKDEMPVVAISIIVSIGNHAREESRGAGPKSTGGLRASLFCTVLSLCMAPD